MNNKIDVVDIEPFDTEECKPSKCQKEGVAFTNKFLEEDKPQIPTICCYDCCDFEFNPNKHCLITGKEIADETAEVNCQYFRQYED